MEEKNEHLENIREIRSMMERATQFISLSGLSGVFAGITALLGALVIFIFKADHFIGRNNYGGIYSKDELINGSQLSEFLIFIIATGFIMLILALFFAYFFTNRNAKRKGLPVWNNSAKRMIINLTIPLITGGLFCFILIYHNLIFLLAPATLIFYGLSLINASKYTFRDIRYLGLTEILLGLIASVWVGYGLLFWALGFGILHIIYGLTMYWKYERIIVQS
jgi:hypothetical protein